MRQHDRGATLIEVIMAIVLIGILIPAVYATILAIDRGLHHGQQQEQAYDIALRVVERVKIENRADIDQEALNLPPGYEVTVVEKTPADPDASDTLVQYEVNVARNGVVVLKYSFYYWRDGTGQ
ncbi:MAG TPA: prepilin-type N-terminal cleavage/methylation domain-containing protein [Firmicutes bacterium]|jgi:prepilin-type N-terminal cleavage/methylation domain-containing protein|nr:prepilin-type N-terminal cleavage/methylation domain-containing protein [Bacillota bacterium]